MSNDPKFPFDEDNKPPLIPKDRNPLMKKGMVVEPSTTPMNGSMVWLKNVSPKYHRVWQT
jgi:hypothetical protein